MSCQGSNVKTDGQENDHIFTLKTFAYLDLCHSKKACRNFYGPFAKIKIIINIYWNSFNGGRGGGVQPKIKSSIALDKQNL